ncbi:MAG TPA: MBL fold metallo-hydrolase [Cytophagaceae bacterium]|nr:MBL fold metallo-hydrolase [Cytophagaceae bacterium]
MIKVDIFTFNPFQENTYLLHDESRECVIIDPGCYEREEQEELTSFIEINNLKVVELLNTHCHIDHVLGNYFVKEKYKVKLAANKIDEPILKAVKVYAPNYGFVNYTEATIDRYIDEGDQIKFGNTTLDILFVPGHAPGHVAFYNSKENICIGGDVLFAGSIGRTDLPGGNFETLIKSIQDKIFSLGEAMVVYPGHGPETTVGREMRSNPYCALRA